MADSIESPDDDAIEDLAEDLFGRFVTESAAWQGLVRGPVSPTAAAFFASCAEDIPAMVHWARWLRIEHEDDLFSAPVALALVEAMVVMADLPGDVAARMREAAQEPRPWDNPLYRQRNRN